LAFLFCIKRKSSVYLGNGGNTFWYLYSESIPCRVYLAKGMFWPPYNLEPGNYNSLSEPTIYKILSLFDHFWRSKLSLTRHQSVRYWYVAVFRLVISKLYTIVFAKLGYFLWILTSMARVDVFIITCTDNEPHVQWASNW
jgi:hypothetical protein